MQKKGKDRSRSLLTGSPLLLLVVAAAAFGFWLVNRGENVRELSYGSLMHICKADDPTARFQNVLVRKGSEISGELLITDTISDGSLKPKHSDEKPRAFRTRIGLASDESLLKLLDKRVGPNYQGAEDRTFLEGVQSTLFLTFMFIPFLLLGFLLVRWMAGSSGAFSFGRSKHKLYAQKDVRITFQDVAGIDEAVAELREVVDFLKTPEKYQALGGRIPKGVMLVGPPGTGKTLLGKAVAGEADVPFFSMSGSDFVELFVGVGASRVRDLFTQAEAQAPCIIFIDELDALGKTRHGFPGGGEERESTLNALLVELDGFDSNRGVIIMAATNRPETLDSALMRPGRFDRTVVVDRPDVSGREAILKVHTRSVKLADDVDLRHVASLTPGSAGADLANIVNEAALLAARKSRNAVTMDDFNEAIERGAIGLERKSRIMSAEDKLRIAYHEGGHALVACALPNTHPVHKVTIIPRGLALGYVLSRPEDDRHMRSKGELESDIKVALGGTLAEEIVYNEICTGAVSDLNMVNSVARKMVKMYGMSRLGRIFYPDTSGSQFLGGALPYEGPREFSEETAREIDLEVRKIVEDAILEVRTILLDRRTALNALAKLLMEKETIDGKELREILDANYPGPKLVPASRAITAVERPGEEKADEVRESKVP